MINFDKSNEVKLEQKANKAFIFETFSVLKLDIINDASEKHL